jgi:hypothetical protein
MRFLKWLIPLLVLGFIGYAVLTSWHNWIVTESRPKPTLNWGDVRIKVLNASGVLSAGRDISEFLSRDGFDVYRDSNNYEIRPRTRMVDRRDTLMKYARELRNAVLVPARKLGPFTISARVQPEIGCEIDSLLYVECTVVLGSNYRTFFPVSPRPF